MQMSMKVIGAGLGRTGTMSLKFALEQIGFGPCFHMIELMKMPERIPLWDRAGKGEPVDWDEVLNGFNATVDWPSCTFYRELAARYPDAKVILTLRDADKWFDSTQATIFKAMDQLVAATDNPMGSMVRNVIMRMFDYNMHDRAHCIAVYNKHNEDVRKNIPASRLLVFNPAEGWKPLCDFLGVPVPATPFPSVNSTEEFQQKLAPEAAKFAAAQT
jgi:hypothetical protein